MARRTSGGSNSPSAVVPRIAALEPKPNAPMTVRVRVAGKIVATLARTRCEELRLREGLAWTTALRERVSALAAQDAAREAAFKRLARSALSEAALHAALVRAGHTDGAVKAAVQELRAAGWLNDAAYAADRAERLTARAPLAEEAIAIRLEADGVDPALAARTAAAAAPADPIGALTREARAARRAGTSVRTLAARLARRGFDEDTVLTALNAAGYAVDAS